jgi:hypothetical protein
MLNKQLKKRLVINKKTALINQKIKTAWYCDSNKTYNNGK